MKNVLLANDYEWWVWSDLKNKLTKEGSQLYENIVQLKFEAADGKKYDTDCLDTPNLLRLIQSIPSPQLVLVCNEDPQVCVCNAL